MSQAITGIGKALVDAMKALQPSDAKKETLDHVRGAKLDLCKMVDRNLTTARENDPRAADEVTLKAFGDTFTYAEARKVTVEDHWMVKYFDKKVQGYLAARAEGKKFDAGNRWDGINIDDARVRRHMADKVGFAKFSNIDQFKRSFKALAEELDPLKADIEAWRITAAGVGYEEVQKAVTALQDSSLSIEIRDKHLETVRKAGVNYDAAIAVSRIYYAKALAEKPETTCVGGALKGSENITAARLWADIARLSANKDAALEFIKTRAAHVKYVGEAKESDRSALVALAVIEGAYIYGKKESEVEYDMTITGRADGPLHWMMIDCDHAAAKQKSLNREKLTSEDIDRLDAYNVFRMYYNHNVRYWASFMNPVELACISFKPWCGEGSEPYRKCSGPTPPKPKCGPGSDPYKECPPPTTKCKPGFVKVNGKCLEDKVIIPE